ncbi:MAG: hypothetical protein GXP49_18540 [Deltaproteobacteria bacterium]|nr:hypothetical protein [Deltaproteobacteria bacterium]
MTMKWPCIFLMTFLMISPLAMAEDNTSAESVPQIPADRMELGGALGGELGFGMIGEDLTLRVNLMTEFTFWKFGIGIQAPLNLIVYDRDPKEDLVGGVLRKRDWDEASDYLKILRYFRFGHKGGLVYLLAGDLRDAYIGHGTIVGHYYNNPYIDHFRLGLQLDVNTDYGGIETIFSRLSDSEAPGVAGGRIHIKPFSFWDKDSYLNNFAIGFSYIGDFKAPYQLKDVKCNKINTDIGCNKAGDLTPNMEGDGLWDQDDEGNLVVQKHQRITIFGFDLEFKVLNLPILSITPYFDIVKIIGYDYGVHLGVLNQFRLPFDIGLTAKVEYRYLGKRYLPTYFDAAYEGYRYLFPYETNNGQSAEPKLKALEDGVVGDARHGYYGELAFNIGNLFKVGGIWEDYQGKYNSNLTLTIEVPALKVVQFYALYYKRNFEGATEIFTLDDKSMLLASLRVPLYSILYLQATYRAMWEYDQEQGEYSKVDDWSFGVGISYTF